MTKERDLMNKVSGSEENTKEVLKNKGLLLSSIVFFQNKLCRRCKNYSMICASKGQRIDSEKFCGICKSRYSNYLDSLEV